MISAQNLEAIEAEGERILAYVRRDPDRPVPHYPKWTLRDLVTHVASIHARTALVCTALPQDGSPPIELPDGLDPCDWFAQTLRSMLEALRVLDPEAQGWTLFSDRRVSTWERRMVIETGVHRWDAQSASEAPEPLLPIVARHGLDEFSDLWLPRLGDVPTLRVEATDLGQAWTYGAGRPQATAQGTASDIFLRLMARPGVVLPVAWADAVDLVPTPPGAA
jgi:uncharacterized protein (TIGR03083 family)